MVTASHNPKEDNGYKVYFDNGAQIISPHDSGISKCIQANLLPRPESWDIGSVDGHKLRTEPFDDCYKGYYESLKKMCHHRDLNAKTPLRFTYTAMHGVGYDFSVESFKCFDHVPFIPVREQIVPDPEFPTVSFPNPEEGKSALNLAIKTADENNSTIILANDPDADRLAIAEKTESGEWKIFNGNEIGALFGWWLWYKFQQEHKAELEADPGFAKNVFMLYSTVSSHILRAIAEKEGFSSEDTLTGFKWMGNRAHDLMKEGKKILFCFEEAIGFLCSMQVLDKDGISAEAIIAELAVYLNHFEQRTLSQKVDWIYDTYGYHVSCNSYYLCYNKANIDKMFYRLRHYKDLASEEITYPDSLGPYKIDRIRDLTEGINIDFTKDCAKTKPNFPISKKSHMITFYFANGTVLTIRTSGTEPKIKWYSEIRQLDMSKTREDVKNELNNLVQMMIAEFYQPEINFFTARSN